MVHKYLETYAVCMMLAQMIAGGLTRNLATFASGLLFFGIFVWLLSLEIKNKQKED